MVINFWYPSCPPCRAEMPNLEDAHKRSEAAGTNIAFVGIQGMAVDTAARGIEFLDSLGVTYPGIPDMSGGHSLGVRSVSCANDLLLGQRAQHRGCALRLHQVGRAGGKARPDSH